MACLICGYKGKKANYIHEDKEYCGDCLIDELARKGIIVELRYDSKTNKYTVTL